MELAVRWLGCFSVVCCVQTWNFLGRGHGSKMVLRARIWSLKVFVEFEVSCLCYRSFLRKRLTIQPVVSLLFLRGDHMVTCSYMHSLPVGCGYSMNCKTSWISYCMFSIFYNLCVCLGTNSINLISYLAPPSKKTPNPHWKAEEFSFMSYYFFLEKHLFTFIHRFKSSSK